MLALLLIAACTKDTPQDSSAPDPTTDSEAEVCTDTWWPDGDGDGFGDASAEAVTACEQPSDHVDNDSDCDDADPEVSPNQFEICDGLDNNCDGEADESGALGESTFYADDDEDGFGNALSTLDACDVPEGYVEDDTDCDDADPDIHPAAEEVCNYDDDDCDGDVDEGVDPEVWFADDDGDGYGDATVSVAACTAPADYVADHDDCDDDDASIHPGATETCDGVDQDCDGDIDDGATDGSAWYADTDGDGYGDATSSVESCDQPSGYVADDTDCDDGAATTHPGADEWCDGVDRDCDGSTDDAASLDALTWYADTDSDGYGDPASTAVACDQPSGYVDDSSDCDDTDADLNPDTIWYADADADGYGDASATTTSCAQPSGYVDDDTDCDDDDGDIHPAATEVCDGNDNDCDGDTDEGFSGTPTTWYADSDSDGYGDADSTLDNCDASAPSGYTDDDTDCDDTDGSVHPGATEYCDSVDNDCDGTTDEDDAADASTFYADDDSDGYGDATSTTTACAAPTGYVSDDTDCDDTDADVSPGATEVCDDLDNDCDGTVDEDDASDATDWYPDADSDGFGDDSASATTQCDQPSGYVADDSDCDDSADDVNPDELEYCDSTDHDCDGDTEAGAVDATTWYTDSDGDGYGDDSSTTEACTQPSGTSDVGGDCDDTTSSTTTGDTYYADADGDGYGDASSTTVECSAGSGYVSDDTDCDDDDADTYPGASETCFDGVVNDCDGTEADALAACTLQGTIPTSDASLYVYGEQAGDELGHRVTTAGDQDGDGIEDLLVSAPEAQNDKTKQGLVFLIHGLTSGVDAATATVQLAGGASGDMAGDSLAGGLDVDGDGQDDFAVGASEYSTNDGAVYIYTGPVTSEDAVLDSSVRIEGVNGGDCGGDLADAGDVDADGFDDLVVGCDNWSSKRGGFLVMYGPMSGLTELADADGYQHSTSSSYLGTAVTGLGDTDGDGHDDVAATAPGAATGAGAAYVFLGPQTAGITTAMLAGDGTYSGNSASDACGDDVVSGDFDGDGLQDLAMSCSDIGEVALFLGPATGTLNITSAYGTVSAGTSVGFGSSLGSMPDLDGDGVDELVVGAPRAGTSGWGSTYLFYGPFSGTTAVGSADAEITGGTNADNGTDVYGGGDFDGDGIPDLAVTSPNQDAPSGQGVAGIVFVLQGAAY